MDASKIFIIALAAVYFGIIVYLAVLGKRNIRAEALKAKVHVDTERSKSEEQRPRDVA